MNVISSLDAGEDNQRLDVCTITANDWPLWFSQSAWDKWTFRGFESCRW